MTDNMLRVAKSS